MQSNVCPNEYRNLPIPYPNLLLLLSFSLLLLFLLARLHDDVIVGDVLDRLGRSTVGY